MQHLLKSAMTVARTDTLVHIHFSNQRRQVCSKSMNEPFDPPAPLCNEFPFAGDVELLRRSLRTLS